MEEEIEEPKREAAKPKQVRITVAFSNVLERDCIFRAVKKINEEAGNGVDLKVSGFMKNAAIEKAQEVLGE